jgi:CRP-like cAMP-binding protein
MSFATAGKAETYDAAILGPGDVIEESEELSDGTRVHSADIVAASSGVVVYSVPQATFYKYTAFAEVSKHRNSRRKEFINQQTELKPVACVD